MLSLLQEKRPLKRSRLGPPDVYPQEAKQREDELTPTNVKHGFATMPPLSDEFGTAHNSNVNAIKVGAFFNSILSKKEELMTLQDTVRKKQQINCKDNFWPVSPRTKGALDAWFKDLAGNKPLLSLAKKAPSFNKKDDIFITLCDNQVNMQRATWFIKLSAAYTLSFTESKNKKRSIYDPAAEWTGNIIKFMKELLPKLQEYFHQNYAEKSSQNNGMQSASLNSTSLSSTHTSNSIPTSSMASPVPMLSPANNQNLSSLTTPSNTSAVNNTNISGISSSFEDGKNALKYWNYCTQLSKYMHEESLLDRQEFLYWILELLDKMRTQHTFDESLKKLVLTFALQYMHDFVQSERLCRKLAYIVGKKISNLLNAVVDQQQQQQQQQFPNEKPLMAYNNNNALNDSEDIDMSEKRFGKKINTMNPYEQAMNDYMNCPHHHDILLYLSTILQIITIECPTAMVWCGIGDNRTPSALHGSPLDNLPLSPSSLPMPAKCERTNIEIRRQLRAAEADIIIRSKHAEKRWFAEKWQKASKNAYTDILKILDYLDTHCFDKMDSSNSIDSLYAKIFTPFLAVKQELSANGEMKEIKIEYDPKQDSAIVKILCEWAVSNQRWGEHRAIVVAILLDKRQIDVTSVAENDQYNNNCNANNNEDKDSVASGVGLIGGLPVFQSVLMDFLDHDAPVLDENGTLQNRTQFTNLVHLFSALIRHDVFSHNAYMYTLISRGDLQMETPMVQNTENKAAITVTGPVSNKPASPNQNFEDDFASGIDFKHGEFDDSNVDDDLDKLLQNIKEKGQQNALEAPDSPKIPDHPAAQSNDPPISRHFIYTKHFPIPQDDHTMSYSSESNQRYILLFGVGKERDEKKHAVKKMSKEICKLFSKKFSIDVAEGGKVKKHSRNEFNFEATTSKCQNMAYFDQHVVTSQCAATVLEQLNSFTLGNNNYLPVQEHVAFLFDLMEMALNIYSLLELCDLILKELPEVENQLIAKKSNLAKSYTTSLGLYIVGILRRYHSCLLLSPEQTVSVFEGLCKIIKHVNNPSECSSAERCILAYLSDLYCSCSILENKNQSPDYFQQLTAIAKFKEIFSSPETLSIIPQSYNPQFLQELFISPKRGGKIDLMWVRQLNESLANIYSFVSNAIIAICRETDNDRLNDIAISCAELTASCNDLSEEWIAALQSICNASKKPRYPHLFGQIDIHNVKIHNSLAIFTCILVARHCFSLADFVVNFALPALANACQVGGGGGEITADAEAGARLTCHLVLKLFKTIEIPQPGLYSVSNSPNPINAVGPVASNIKLSCDRHLLMGAHKNIPIEAVLAVLKAILLVVDTTALKTTTSLTGSAGFSSGGKRSGLNTPVHPGSTPKSNDRPVDLSQILGTSDLNNLSVDHDQDLMLQQSSSSSSTNACEQVSLLEFAHHVLKQICSQEYVLERCLKHAEKLCDMIIDDMLTTKQVQRVLHMICYSESEYSVISEMDQKSMIVRILENLGQWTLRISWLDLQLMYRQSISNNTELNNWLDTVARAAIDVFQMDENVFSNHKDLAAAEKAKPSTWLVAPLVSKLTLAVQGRILRVAGQVLESMKYFSKTQKVDNNSSGSGDEREKGNNSCNGSSSSYNGLNGSYRSKKMPLNYQPFLGLVLTCLKGQDEYKEGLLVSLYIQLSQFLQSFSEYDTIGGIEDSQSREEMLDALQLRFSLVGDIFDSIQKNGTSTTEWAILLAQLVCQGVIDLCTNSELFTTVVDMLATLVHSTLVSESQLERDENKKLYLNLMKKLKKEIGEKNNASIKVIRQMLPLYKQTTEVISCEPAGVDTKGNKICDIDRKQLRISDKQRISVWDILEGHKNPAPLSWVWFGAVKLERKPLAYEEAHRNLKYHMHSLVKPSSYYYEPLPLPPEEVDPVPEKVCIKDEMKADTPSSVDQSPSAVVTGRRGKGTTRKRKPKNPKTPPVNTQTQPPLQQQQHQQSQQSTPQQINPNQMNQMQMNMQVNMQQFGPTQMMQQNSNQMMPQQQMQQVPSNMQQQLNSGNAQQNTQMGFLAGGSQGIAQGNHPGQQQQQQWPGQNQYMPMQQQFYQQQGMQMNRFERPQINNSKQALSNMLRQRQPTYNQNNPAAFNAMQQQQQQQQQQQRQTQGIQQQTGLNSVQQQQQMQQQQFVRGTLRGIAPNQIPSGTGSQMAVMNPVSMGQVGQGTISQGMNQNPMLSQQQIAQGCPQQSPQALAMAQNSGLLSRNNSNNSMMGQPSNASIVNSGNIMQQNVGGNSMVNQGPNQFQNFNNYNQEGMNQVAPNQQAVLMGNFNQMNQRSNSNDFIAQQQQRGSGLQGNRGQYMNTAPNVTMNNIMGQGGGALFSRQPGGGGKPAVVSSQQQFQQQRMHHQMMQMQGIGPQNTGNTVMGQSQNQSMGQQQTPNLVAQLQRQLPSQQNLMGQQFQHQPPPY